MNDFKIFLILITLNTLTFIFYGMDKFYAKKNMWRIKEIFLISMGIFGGGFGGLLGMKYFHHKTRKFYFYISNFMGILLIVYFYLYLF